MDMATISSFAGIGVLALVALLTLIGALKGRKRGFFRQLVRTITIVASLFLSIFAAKFLFSFITNWMTKQGPTAVLNLIESKGLKLGDLKQVILLLDQESFVHIMAVPLALIVLPIIFLALFVIISTVLRLVHAMICKIFGFHKWRNNFFTRLLGFTLGAVQGLLVALICLVPIIGISSTVSAAVADLEAKEPTSETTVEVKKFYDKNLKAFAEDSSLQLLGKLGGNKIYAMITTVDVNGASHNMSEEVGVPSVKTYAALKELVDVDWRYLTVKDKAAIDTLLTTAKESPYMALLLADTLDSMAKAYNNGALGVIADEGPSKDFVDALLSTFVGIDENSVVPTLEVVRDVLFMLDDENVLASLATDPSLLSDILSKKEDGETLLARVIDKLEENQRTATLVTTITKISISVMAESFPTVEGVEITTETYDNVKDGISEVISINKKDFADEDSYVAAISESLNTTFTDNGIVLDATVVDGMAKHVADNYSDVDELTDEEVNDIILSYYAAYLENAPVEE